MAVSHSFIRYIREKYNNEFWKVAEQFHKDNQAYIESQAATVYIDGTAVIDVCAECIWVEDLPGMEIGFEVALSVVIGVNDYTHPQYGLEQLFFGLRIECRGDLSKELEDFKILSVSKYNGQKHAKNLMDNSLVPIISYTELEDVAEDFLKRNFPEALVAPKKGQPPVRVDPIKLANKLNLSVQTHCIKRDSSIFGQIYFKDADAKIYDEETEEEVLTHIKGGTILVDPRVSLLRNTGSANTTIIHECVHWDKHRKAFILEQLYNKNACCISCGVIGGAVSGISPKAAKFMEKQANQLAPRIQMPRASFKAKANEYITAFLEETGAQYEMDVMERVINRLATDFSVSRQAAKIRLVELGFDGAIGAFNYVDGKYIRPHGFREGFLKPNQTFTIGARDAGIEWRLNAEFREKTKNGDYLFIENHYVYNSPLYVCSSSNGKLILTDYARAHMDECCLVFELHIKGKIDDAYHTICFLNRGLSNVTFEVKYHNGYQNAPKERQNAMRKKEQAEWMNIRAQMTDDPKQCMDLLLDWRKKKYTELGDLIERSPKTISRIVNGETEPNLKTAIRICFGLNLPPKISEKLLSVWGCRLKPTNPEHQWIDEALHVVYPQPLWAVKEYLQQYDVKI